MAQLQGNTIASTYTGLLSVSGAVGADTVEAVTDGAGTSTSLSLSQERATITLGSGAADDFIVDGTTLVVEGDNNRVGIGTAAPGSKLEIAGGADAIARVLGTTTAARLDLQTDSHHKFIQILESDGRFRLYNQTTNREQLTVQSDGFVGIGDTSPDAHLDVENLALDTTTSYTGINSQHTKTLGATDASDGFTGISSYVTWDDDGALDSYFGTMVGIYSSAVCDDSVGESTAIQGSYVKAKMVIGDVGNMYGTYTLTDIDGGTVDADVYGQLTFVDIDGGTLSDNVFGHQLAIDTTVNPSGQVFGYRCTMEGAGMDATNDKFLLFHDSQNSDTVAQITALAGVATFDSGNFDGAGDYAEYLESKDGNAIAVGTTVKLDGDKVVACSEGDTPIGVVRPDGVGTSAYKTGCKNLRWQGKYLYDDFNELQHEDYTIKQWTEEITFDEYIARGKDETGGVLGGSIKDEKVEGSKAIPAKEAVTQQKTVDKEVEEEVTTTEVVLEDGKYVQKTTTETVTKTVKVPQYDEVDLYDKDGEVIGKHQVPIMETVEEAVAGVDAVVETYFRKHNYHSDRIPEGLTVPDDAETVTPNHQRKKLNPDYDASKHDDYKSRPDRDEWNLIGLLGQIPITKGQPVADNWIKMKDVSDTVEMYFVK
jgi:hypothetical protein